MKSKARNARSRQCSTTTAILLNPLLLIVHLLWGHQCYCALFVDAFATVAATRAASISIERLGNNHIIIPPSRAIQTATTSFSSTIILASRNKHPIHHRNRATTQIIMMSVNQERQRQQRPKRISSISSPEILDNYDTFLLDMWGVLHDGKEPYDGVLQAIQGLKQAKKKLIILSNSSKRRDNSEEMLIKLGFDPADFDNIITSGDLSHNLLRGLNSCGIENDWKLFADNQGRRNVFVFGSGDDDEEYCTSAGWNLTSIDDADLILARGTFTINDGRSIVSKTEDEDEYWKVMEESMMKAARRKLPMLVTNPDKIRPGSSPPPPMPGAIGDAYERFVWTTHCHPVGDMTEERAREYVKRIGKPFREVYDVALNGSNCPGSSVDRARAIMIGDALETDGFGGYAAGIDMLWVTQDGIHGKDVEAKGADAVLEDFNGRSESTYAYGEKVLPRYLTDHFRW